MDNFKKHKTTIEFLNTYHCFTDEQLEQYINVQSITTNWVRKKDLENLIADGYFYYKEFSQKYISKVERFLRENAIRYYAINFPGVITKHDKMDKDLLNVDFWVKETFINVHITSSFGTPHEICSYDFYDKHAHLCNVSYNGWTLKSYADYIDKNAWPSSNHSSHAIIIDKQGNPKDVNVIRYLSNDERYLFSDSLYGKSGITTVFNFFNTLGLKVDTWKEYDMFCEKFSLNEKISNLESELEIIKNKLSEKTTLLDKLVGFLGEDTLKLIMQEENNIYKIKTNISNNIDSLLICYENVKKKIESIPLEKR